MLISYEFYETYFKNGLGLAYERFCVIMCCFVFLLAAIQIIAFFKFGFKNLVYTLTMVDDDRFERYEDVFLTVLLNFFGFLFSLFYIGSFCIDSIVYGTDYAFFNVGWFFALFEVVMCFFILKGSTLAKKRIKYIYRLFNLSNDIYNSNEDHVSFSYKERFVGLAKWWVNLFK